jgi:predicted rRNA methylase YqxC with S4 and FtsJ domains
MNLYELLKEKNLIANKKEFQELILNREIRVNSKIINDPTTILDLSTQQTIKIGILEIQF